MAVSHRFLHERHEQTKQDLKGLEETVVSKTQPILIPLFCSAITLLLPSTSLICRPANSRPSTTCASCLFKTSRRGLKKYGRQAIMVQLRAVSPELSLVFLLHHRLCRVPKWNLMIAGGLAPRSRRFPFLRITWTSLQRFTNRRVTQRKMVCLHRRVSCCPPASLL